MIFFCLHSRLYRISVRKETRGWGERGKGGGVSKEPKYLILLISQVKKLTFGKKIDTCRLGKLSTLRRNKQKKR